MDERRDRLAAALAQATDGLPQPTYDGFEFTYSPRKHAEAILAADPSLFDEARQQGAREERERLRGLWDRAHMKAMHVKRWADCQRHPRHRTVAMTDPTLATLRERHVAEARREDAAFDSERPQHPVPRPTWLVDLLVQRRAILQALDAAIAERDAALDGAKMHHDSEHQITVAFADCDYWPCSKIASHRAREARDKGGTLTNEP